MHVVDFYESKVHVVVQSAEEQYISVVSHPSRLFPIPLRNRHLIGIDSWTSSWSTPSAASRGRRSSELTR